jgi:cytoskeletal protein CcmA (bactofilin family)
MAKIIQTENTGVINIIGNGTKITGNIETSGDIRIDGTLIGNIETQGRIVIGETGLIQGKVKCLNSDISGQVKGEISVKELLSLKSTANIQGDISTNKLAIEPNAIFTGFCNMGGDNIIDNNQEE